MTASTPARVGPQTNSTSVLRRWETVPTRSPGRVVDADASRRRSGASRSRWRRPGPARPAAGRPPRVVEALVGEREQDPRRRGSARPDRPARPRPPGGSCRRTWSCGSRRACRRRRSGRGVPAEQRLPDVVVREVGVLVVRRVEVGDVDAVELAGQLVGVAPHRGARRSGHLRRLAQLERLQRPGRPALEVGHLDADRRVHAVGRLDQARQQQRRAPTGRGRAASMAALGRRRSACRCRGGSSGPASQNVRVKYPAARRRGAQDSEQLRQPRGESLSSRCRRCRSPRCRRRCRWRARRCRAAAAPGRRGSCRRTGRRPCAPAAPARRRRSAAPAAASSPGT